jgi:RHH-type rel operon transcriptional repressor/antitoxin RelB
MLSVRLDETIQTKLDNLANITKRSKSFFVKEALNSYLDDMADYLEVQKRNQNPTQNLISIGELEAALNV